MTDIDFIPDEHAKAILRDRACAGIGPVFRASIPKQKVQKIGQIFRAVRDSETTFKEKETLLLSAMNQLPGNPFIAMRLAFFYAGHGQRYNAVTMMNKAESLGRFYNVSQGRLLNQA